MILGVLLMLTAASYRADDIGFSWTAQALARLEEALGTGY